MPTFKYALLKELILERYGTMSKFARVIGLSDSALSHIFAGTNTLTQQNMINFSKKLGIPHDKFYDYFFT